MTFYNVLNVTWGYNIYIVIYNAKQHILEHEA